MTETPILTPKTGRPRSIPESVYGQVFRLYSEGLGYRAVADRLGWLGVNTTGSSVRRLIAGQPPYQGRRVAGTH